MPSSNSSLAIASITGSTTSLSKLFQYFIFNSLNNGIFYREFVADSVIQATRTVEFEDGLRTVVHLGGCWGP